MTRVDGRGRFDGQHLSSVQSFLDARRGEIAHVHTRQVAKVASPVPLKTNAVLMVSKDKRTKLCLTLTQPGASVTALVDVVEGICAPRPPPKPPVA